MGNSGGNRRATRSTVVSAVMDAAAEAVLQRSSEVEDGTPHVEGYAFEEEETDYNKLLESMVRSGFQATALGRAMDEVNRMLAWRLSQEEGRDAGAGMEGTEVDGDQVRTKIFLGFTSNLISSGVRESILYLVKNRMVDVLVTTAGGVEEDFIKCMAKTYLGDFNMRGKELREKGMNRIGNLIVPNDNYCKFEDWFVPILDRLLLEQEEDGVAWTPSKIIHRLGKEIDCTESVYYWCYKNDIPVYCPALTDGSMGDMIYFHAFKNPGLRIDIVGDIVAMNNEAVYAKPRKTGVIILGGGLPKHHICNANLMKNGADFAVFVNTAQEFDGSDSGARPDEAVSWGKIRVDALPVKVCCDATIAFPLIVAQTFKKNLKQRN